MSVLEDVCLIRRFHYAPLIPYLFGDKGNYSIGYLTVSFADEEYDDKSIIERVDAAAVRNGENFEEINVPQLNYPVVLNFGADKMNLYQQKADEYCALIDECRYEDAVAMFEEIVCNDLKDMYKKIFKE